MIIIPNFQLFDSDSLKLLHRRVFFSIIIFFFVFSVSIYRISEIMLFSNINEKFYDEVSASRGDIYDVNGNLLSTSINSRSISINPKKIKNKNKLIIKLSEILNLKEDFLNKN